MMNHAFSCGRCGKRYQARPEMIGQRAKCKQCGTECLIPAPGQPARPILSRLGRQEEAPSDRRALPAWASRLGQFRLVIDNPLKFGVALAVLVGAVVLFQARGRLAAGARGVASEATGALPTSAAVAGAIREVRGQVGQTLQEAPGTTAEVADALRQAKDGVLHRVDDRASAAQEKYHRRLAEPTQETPPAPVQVEVVTGSPRPF